MSKETKDELSKAELLEKEDTRFMKEAFRQAKKAYKLGEVPIGCVIVYEGEIIARGYNRRKTDKNTLCHARRETAFWRQAPYGGPQLRPRRPTPGVEAPNGGRKLGEAEISGYPLWRRQQAAVF